MSTLDIVGLILMVVGVVEFVVFRAIAPSKPNIARALPLLMANCAFNFVLGIVLILV